MGAKIAALLGKSNTRQKKMCCNRAAFSATEVAGAALRARDSSGCLRLRNAGFETPRYGAEGMERMARPRSL